MNRYRTTRRRIRRASDSEVVSASQNDPAVFGEIYSRHAPTILSYFRRRLPEEDAKDCTIETFTRAFHRRSSYRPEHESCLPWLFGFATNILLSTYRELDGMERSRRAAIESARFDFHDDLSAIESQALRDAVRRLDEPRRTIVELYYWLDFSTEQISESLGVSGGTVRSNLARARKVLAGQLRFDDSCDTPAVGRSRLP